jgi:folate-binding protein YgfZ
MDNNPGSLFTDGQTNTAFYEQEKPGYLRIAGDDRHAFLQRQTTNDINLLSPERSLVTMLTSPAGRILDVLWVIDEDEAFGVLTLPGQGEQTFNFLSGRIFFMDKVSLVNASQEICQIDLLGPGASEFLHELGAIRNQQDNETLTIKIAQAPVRVLFQRNTGHHLLIPKESCHQVLNELENNGAAPLSPESYAIIRIETGLPAAGHELTEDYTPLETGFQWTVSDNKGCYTGQEVIARQVNYDKITRQLVGLLMNDVPQIGDSLYPLDKEQPVGKITSMALSQRFGPIALAIVKRPFHQPGNELITHKEEQSITASTTTLPFQ